jgi:formate dehydrogenase major subunit
MDVTRRDFLKISGTATAGLMLGSLFDLAPIKAYATANPPQWDTVTTSICCYCAVGCGLLVCTNSSNPDEVYVQGDPDHPINRGSLCSKGQAIGQLHTVDGAVNPKRLTQPLYRASGAASWTPVSWDWALGQIAQKIKDTRDGTNPYDGQPNTIDEEEIDGVMTPVNRCRAIACLGGAAHDNEECYLLVKLMRALGLVYLEHQARI